MPLRSASLRRRIQLLVMVFVLLFAVDGVLAGVALGRLDGAERRLTQEVEPAAEATGELRSALVDQETSLRGYLITGQAPFLEPFQRGQDEQSRLVDRLQVLLRDDARQRAALNRLRDAIARWQEMAVGPELAAGQRGDAAGARALVASGVGKALFDEVRARLDDLERSIGADLRSIRRRLDRTQGQLASALLATLALAALVGLATAWLLQRWITAPLDQLSEAVRAVAGGALAQPVPAPGPPELVGLGTDVERMRRRILDELDEAVRAQEALAQRAPTVLALREELAPHHREAPAGLAVAARFAPAEGVLAGDWYDLVDLGSGRHGLAVVDISGHGPVAGVLALRTKELLLAALRQGMAPGDALGWMARQLGDTGESFVTGVAVEIDLGADTVRYASAGHPPILSFGGSSGGRSDVGRLGPTGPLLGPLEGRWGTTALPFGAGAKLAVYTDGLVEAHGPNGEEFGTPRLAELLRRHGDEEPEAIAEACFGAVRSFCRGRLADDVTLVVLART